MTPWLSVVLLPLLPLLVTAQNSRIRDLVTKLRTAPGPKSHSPSYTSHRKFDVIGSGELPLQSTGLTDDGAVEDNERIDDFQLPFLDLAPALNVQLTEAGNKNYKNEGK